MGSQVSKKGKGTYLVYKSENRALNNKIKKLERLVKKFPLDKAALNRLDELKNTRVYKPRAKPLIPGSNPTTPKIKQYVLPKGLILAKTAGEQLSELLGIPLIRTTNKKRRKPKITIRKKKNVRA